MKLFNFNSKKKPAKPGAKNASKKKFILSRKQKVIAIVGSVLVLGGAGYWAYASYTMGEVSAGGCVSNLYKKGAVKTCVKYAQQMLGMSNPSSSFSSAMYKNVEAFQSKYGLTVDGIIGPKTWKKLCSKGVNATAKKNAGCDDASSSSTSKTTTGWTKMDRLVPEAYEDAVWVDVKACKKEVRNGTYVVKANLSDYVSRGTSATTGAEASLLLSDSSSASDRANFRTSLRIQRVLRDHFNVTLTSRINVSGSEKFYIKMYVNGYEYGSDRTDYTRVDSLLTCS